MITFVLKYQMFLYQPKTHEKLVLPMVSTNGNNPFIPSIPKVVEFTEYLESEEMLILQKCEKTVATRIVTEMAFLLGSEIYIPGLISLINSVTFFRIFGT